MRWFLFLIVLVALAGGAVAGYQPALEYIEAANRPTFRVQSAERGDVTEVINATGTIEPVESVHVGAFVSGTIVTLAADFNNEVEAGDLLAEIDPRLYESNVARDEATLAARKAELQRAEAMLEHAQKDEERAKSTKARSPNSIPDAEIDEVTFSRIAKEAGHPASTAKRLGQDALVRLQGALVVARVSGDCKSFQRVVRELPELLTATG